MLTDSFFYQTLIGLLIFFNCPSLQQVPPWYLDPRLPFPPQIIIPVPLTHSAWIHSSLHPRSSKGSELGQPWGSCHLVPASRHCSVLLLLSFMSFIWLFTHLVLEVWILCFHHRQKGKLGILYYFKMT